MDPQEMASQAASLDVTEAKFYAAAFALAVSAGMVRTWSDHRFRDFWHLLSTSLVSGFIGLGCVAFACWPIGGSVGHKPGMVAIAVFVGLMGKEANKIPPLAVEFILRRFGLEIRGKDEPSQ